MPIYPTGKKKDGLQQYRVRVNYTFGGEYRQKESLCYGYREAVELEKRLSNQYSGNGCRGDVPLRDFFESYMRQKQSDLRETSFAKVRSIAEHHILPYFGDVSLCDLDPYSIAEWKTTLTEKKLAVSYRRKIFSSFSSILNYAVQLGSIHENPTKKVENFRNPLFKNKEEEIHYYTPEQFLDYIKVANASVTSYFARSIYVFFAVAYYTGMRKGEIHALRWHDIKKDLIHVQHSISQKVKGKSIVETPPKNETSLRILQIPDPLIQILADYKALQQKKFPSWNATFRVIYGTRCVSDTSLSNYNIKWAEAAGLPLLRIHDFRHSHASVLANEGINIQEIARRLGHSNVQTTWRTYAHLYPREEERAVKVLNQVVSPEFPTKKVEK